MICQDQINRRAVTGRRMASALSEGRIQHSDAAPWFVFSCCLVTQSCPTLCGPTDCSPPGSFVRGTFQAIPSPGDLLDPRIEPESPTLTDSLPLSHQGSLRRAKGPVVPSWYLRLFRCIFLNLKRLPDSSLLP